jgi:general secretion pathway protein G
MVELIFVIVIIGVLAAVAVPKLWATRDDAIISKARNDIASVRSAILNAKTILLLKGEGPYPQSLDDATPNAENQELFDGNSTLPLLEYPIYSKNQDGHWMKTGANQYAFKLSGGSVVSFTYDSTTGKFDCDHTDSNCQLLTQ